MLVFNIFLLLVGFALLIKGADYFVDGASGIADRFGISQIVIGLTVVAFGTSAPEAAVSITAALRGTTDMAVGNVLGSNILNILLILGATACITPLAVQRNTLRYEIPFVIFITAVVLTLGGLTGYLHLAAGLLLMLMFVLFFVYLFKTSKRVEAKNDDATETKTKRPIPQLVLMSAGGIAAIVFGGDLAIDGATYLAKQLGLSDRLIGLTVVALGTSLPELVTSIVAAGKGNSDIAVGNNVGSCIFNLLFVLGTTALISPVGFESSFVTDGLIALGAATLLLLCIVLNRRKQLGRSGGALLLTAFAAYYAYVFLI